MGKTEFKVRNYEKGDEEAQVNIFNTVIVEMNPEVVLIKPEKVQKRHEAPDFNPAQVKYLVNKEGNIVGYNECRVHNGFHGVFYPLILKKYRSEETLNMLFSATYEFARENQKKQPGSIESHYALNLKDAHEYFIRQKIAKVTDTRETKGIYIETAKLDYDVEGYEAKPFTSESIPELIALRTSKESMVGDEITAEILEQRVKDGEMTSENSFLIYRDGTLVGYARAGKYSPADDGLEDTTVNGTLEGMIIDIEDPDGINLRKAMFKAVNSFYKKHGIEKQSSGIYINSPAVKIYKELGYKDESEQGSKHYIYVK